jgi:hypothetical protein
LVGSKNYLNEKETPRTYSPGKQESKPRKKTKSEQEGAQYKMEGIEIPIRKKP